MFTFRQVTGALLAACAPGWISAQSVSFIEPFRFEANRGENMRFVHVESSLAEQHDEPARIVRAQWPLEHIKWFFLRASGTQWNLDQLEPVDEEQMFISFTLEKSGLSLAGLDQAAQETDIDPDRFTRFLDERLGEGVVDTETLELPEDRRVRVRHLESSKTIVRVLDQNPSQDVHFSMIALSKSGQRNEIRPVMDPTRAGAGSDVAFRLYLEHAEPGTTTIIATHAASGTTQTAVIDRAGMCRFRFSQSGVWRLEAHAVRELEQPEQPTRPARGDARADEQQPEWEVHSTTLTFSIPAGEEEDEQ